MTNNGNLTSLRISEYAADIAGKYDVHNSEGRADVTMLLNVLGGSVVVRDTWEASMIHEDGKSFTVYTRRSTSPRRDRFTIAHEIGHYLLHRAEQSSAPVRRFPRDCGKTIGVQANQFAAEILMPEDHFRRAYSEGNGSRWALAGRFDVSPAKADVRCRVLGLEPSLATKDHT